MLQIRRETRVFVAPASRRLFLRCPVMGKIGRRDAGATTPYKFGNSFPSDITIFSRRMKGVPFLVRWP